MLNLFRSDLGYFPVLAEFAVHVAACCSDGHGIGFRKKVEKGFFFNGVHIGGAGFPIDKSVISAVHVFSDSAIPSLFVPQFAGSGAKLTLYLTVRELFVIAGFDFREIGFFSESIEILKERTHTRAYKEACACCSLKKLPPFHPYYIILLLR
jgi:hypothetical protein